MGQCVRYICAASGLICAIEGDRVVIRSKSNVDSTNEKPDHDAVAETPCLDVNAADLRETLVTPVLNAAIPPERNVLWCLTFQLAWNMFKDHLGEPVKMNPMPELARSLNRGLGTSDDIDEECCVAMAGMNIRGKIEAELKRKFKGQARPEQFSDDAIAYAYLFKTMPFKWAFERKTRRFQGRAVACFGIEQLDEKDLAHKLMAEQARVLDQIDKDDFIIELLTLDANTRLILAKIKPRATLVQTVRHVQKRVASEPPRSLLSEDAFSFP